LARPRDPLFDQAAAKIGVNQAALGAGDGIDQSLVADAFRFHKARDAARQKYPHPTPTQQTITL
jgi:hypothetical protein